MPALTGIRFPLALWVVSHHISGPGRIFAPMTGANAPVQAVIDAAWVALSVFFAISGFVLARRYHATTWDRSALARYAIARFGRVYPVYFLSLLILAPIIVDELRGNRLVGLWDRISLVANHVLLLQGWHRPALNWNAPAWSLSSEVFFYALFPLVILLVRNATWPHIFAAACLAFAVPIALRLLIEPPFLKPTLYLGDFLIGVVTARIHDRLRSVGISLPRLGPWLYGPAFASGLVLLLYRDQVGPFVVFDSGVRFVSALIVFGLACGGGPSWRALSSSLMVVGGRASYAIYILHVPVLWWYERSDLRAALPPLPAGIVYVAMVVAISVVVSRQVEEPANAIIRRYFIRRRTSTAVRMNAAPPRSMVTSTTHRQRIEQEPSAIGISQRAGNP